MRFPACTRAFNVTFGRLRVRRRHFSSRCGFLCMNAWCAPQRMCNHKPHTLKDTQTILFLPHPPQSLSFSLLFFHAHACCNLSLSQPEMTKRSSYIKAAAHSEEILLRFLFSREIKYAKSELDRGPERKWWETKNPLRAFRFIHAFKHLTSHHPLVIRVLGPSARSSQ